MNETAKTTSKVECIICKRFIEENKTFICKKCRRSSICFDHFDREYKVCSSCATEKRIKLYNDIQKQERSIKGFLRLSQFVFLVFAILFASNKFLPDYIPLYIKGNIFFEYSVLWGGLSVLGIILCYILRSSQKSRLEEINNKIQDYKSYQKYSR